jgi:hypothetical protein
MHIYVKEILFLNFSLTILEISVEHGYSSAGDL